MTAKIGLFYGSDTGNTELVAEMIQNIIGADHIKLYDMYDVKGKEFDQHDRIIIGASTWYDGQLQSDWDDFYDRFKKIDLTNKKVAFYGLGDQYAYADYFIDAVGILGEIALKNGAQIIGLWPSKKYLHSDSKAEFEKGWFMGLAIDEDNQHDQTEKRVSEWTQLVLSAFDNQTPYKSLKWADLKEKVLPPS